MATTASLLESYIVDLTEASEEDQPHFTPTGHVISWVRPEHLFLNAATNEM